MRIAFVAQPFDCMQPPVRESSLALWVYYMARACATRGHEVTVFGNHGGLLSAASIRHEDVQYIFTPTALDRLINKAARVTRGLNGGPTRSSGRRPAFATAWHHRGYAEHVARAARRLQCDVVHIMSYSQFVPVCRKVYPQCTTVLHMHCEWLTQLDRALIEPRIKQADLIVGCSEHITRCIAMKFPQYSTKCVTVPDSAATVAPSNDAARDSRMVLFVGRLSPEKGVHDLIRAFRLVLQRFPEACLHLVGGGGSPPIDFLVGISDDPRVAGLRVFYESTNGAQKDPYLAFLEKEAASESGKRIFFHGPVPHSQVGDYYGRAAVLVNPSLSEASGICILEAMMHGVPIVATRIGGMTDAVIDRRTGYLVDAGDPSGLASAICNLLANPLRARELGFAGRRHAVEHFSWDKAVDLLLGHFERLSEVRPRSC